METETALDAKAHSERLRAELAEREWHVELRGARERPRLRVVLPDDHGLNGMVACLVNVGRWPWRPVSGLIDDVSGVADRVTHVLPEVAS
ncbi:hypothetical protein [Nonomuraea lactucae]|uniref:hypothetical protein n=1 Tax=Nonomuraea lactucae TaxID=2249762 RepID=UPI0013B45009|nr:hypothetical protein [Nonomuraea lactucae]